MGAHLIWVEHAIWASWASLAQLPDSHVSQNHLAQGFANRESTRTK